VSATLKNDREDLLDKDVVFKDPKAEGREWLEEYRKRREKEEQREGD
jgi:hypothetical protein